MIFGHQIRQLTGQAQSKRFKLIELGISAGVWGYPQLLKK